MPPELDSEIADSSTATEGTSQQDTTDSQDAESSTAQTSDSSAESSTASADKPKSSLDAMKQAQAVLATANAERTGQGKAGESPSQEGSDKDDSTQQGKSEGDGKKDDGKGKGDEKVHPKTEARIQDLTTKLKDAEPKVKNWDSLQGYIVESGFKNPQQFAQFLDIGRMVNLEPYKAIPILEQTLETLKRRVGAAGDLPADLQDRLDKGLIDEEGAREIAAARGKEKYRSQQEEEETQRSEAQREKDAHAARVHTISSAITAAEQAWKKSDPDYAALQQFVEDKVVALLPTRDVRTVEDANKLFKEAVELVKASATNIRGARKNVAPPLEGGKGGKVTPPAPKSSFEAMQRAHRQGG